MSSPSTGPLRWTLVVPILAMGVLLATWSSHEHWLVLGLVAVMVLAAFLFVSVQP